MTDRNEIVCVLSDLILFVSHKKVAMEKTGELSISDMYILLPKLNRLCETLIKEQKEAKGFFDIFKHFESNKYKLENMFIKMDYDLDGFVDIPEIRLAILNLTEGIDAIIYIKYVFLRSFSK